MERDRPARATVLFTDSDGITASPSWHALALPEVCERLSATPAGLDSLVRAKVAYLEHQSGGEKAVCLARYERHLALAGRYEEPASCGSHRPHPRGLRRRQDHAQRGADPAAWGTTHLDSAGPPTTSSAV